MNGNKKNSPMGLYTSKTKNERFCLAVKRYWQLYLLLLIPIIYILVFHYYPMLGLQLAFKKFNAKEGIWGDSWVGFKYFIKFFNSYKFIEVVRNTFVTSFYAVLAQIPIPVILALSLNAVRGQKFKKAAQLLSYMPHFISTVVIVSMMMQMFNTRSGLVAVIAALFGKVVPDIFASESAFKHLYVWSTVWQSAGWASIIYLAALAGVDPEQHEAAIVDGATRFQRVRYIDFPTVIPTASILIILNMGRVMSLGFEKVYLMQNDLNIAASEIISTYTYKIGLTGNADFSYSTAIGLFNSVINLILILMTNKLSKKLSGSGLF